MLGPMVISWKKVSNGQNLAFIAAGTTIMGNDNRISVFVDDVSSTLTILLVNTSDVGQYICEVSSNPPVTLKHTVEIKAPPHVEILGKPQSGPWVRHLKAGDELALICEGSGDPTPSIKWKRMNKKMPDGNEETAADQIIYNSVDRKHAGVYICIGDNGYGSPATDSIEIQVNYQLKIYVDESYLHNSGSVALELVCVVQAHPVAEVVWNRSDKPLQLGRYRVEHRSGKHVLTIDSPTKHDLGVYTCTASNQEGTVHAVIDVKEATRSTSTSSPEEPTSKNPVNIGQQLGNIEQMLLAGAPAKRNQTNYETVGHRGVQRVDHHHHLLKTIFAKVRDIVRTENALFKIVKTLRQANERILENQQNILEAINSEK